MKERYLACLFFMAAGFVAVPSALSAQVPQGEQWKNKVLYAGGSFGLGPIMGPDGTILGGNLNPLQLDWQITGFFSIGSGLHFYFAPQSKYTAVKQTDPDSGILETYAGMETHIVFPLLMALTFRPGNFSVEIGGGPYVAPVAMNTTVERTNDNGYTVAEAYGKNLFTADRNNPFGFFATGSFGIKAGQGILFLDLRYLRDFSQITVQFKDSVIGQHLWSIFSVNVGYKYGFFNVKSSGKR